MLKSRRNNTARIVTHFAYTNVISKEKSFNTLVQPPKFPTASLPTEPPQEILKFEKKEKLEDTLWQKPMKSYKPTPRPS